MIQDRAGHSCLLVLPSDKPSNRKEAMAVEELLAGLLQVWALQLDCLVIRHMHSLSRLTSGQIGSHDAAYI